MGSVYLSLFGGVLRYSLSCNSPADRLSEIGGDAGLLRMKFSTERDPPLQDPSIGYYCLPLLHDERV